ncbi:MAG TPA: hypothetical protein VGC08_04365 [Pedobacter sp.]
MYIPGSKNQDIVSGYSPLYKNPLGIISLSHYPTAVVAVPGSSAGEYYVSYQWMSTFTLDKNSYSIQFNPSVINSNGDGATIQNLKSAFVCPKNYYINYYGGSATDQGVNVESIGDASFVTIDLAARTTPITLDLNYDNIDAATNEHLFTYGQLDSAYLRVSFDVVPNNGATRYTIVKTFKIYTTLHSYEWLT